MTASRVLWSPSSSLSSSFVFLLRPDLHCFDNGADQVSSIATGHTVSIEATVSGDTGTATQIFDRTLRQPN